VASIVIIVLCHTSQRVNVVKTVDALVVHEGLQSVYPDFLEVLFGKPGVVHTPIHGNAPSVVGILVVAIVWVQLFGSAVKIAVIRV
jgi:hypothetical protein